MVSLKKLSVLVVHHAPLTRFGLTTLIKASRRFKVVGATGEAPVARQMFTENAPDLVVLSLTLQRGDGIALLKDFKKLRSRRGCAGRDGARRCALGAAALKAGARGYVVTEDERPRSCMRWNESWPVNSTRAARWRADFCKCWRADWSRRRGIIVGG